MLASQGTICRLPEPPCRATGLVGKAEGQTLAIKVGINGFGRIGRNILRAALAHHDVDVVAVNDITDTNTLAHLLKYDSILGNLTVPVSATADTIKVGSDQFKVLAQKDPALLPWKDLGVDIVFESTGKFTKR